MAKRNIFTIPEVLRQAGTYSLPAVQIGGTGGSKFQIAITRDQLPDTTADVASLSIEGSADGVTWDFLGGITLAGGVLHDKQGNVLLESDYTVSLPTQEPATYQLRGTAVLFQAITAGARLTVF